MNQEMAYLLGMILGNGEVQRGSSETTFVIEIPHKNQYTDSKEDTATCVKASIVDIAGIIVPLVGTSLKVVQNERATQISFKKSNDEYITRELVRLIGTGTRQQTMRMAPELFSLPKDQRKTLMRGVADVTAYIRSSNIGYGQPGFYRVYIEVPANWYMVADIANMLKSIDIPVQTIDWGHPNFRDPNRKKYDEGYPMFWKKEHQIKIYANEFLPIGFNVSHKQKALEKYAAEVLKYFSASKTHKFYWESRITHKNHAPHPGENDPSLPPEIRGQHFSSWTEIAELLGYGK